MQHVGEPYGQSEYRARIDVVSGVAFQRVWRGRADILEQAFVGLSAGGKRAEYVRTGNDASVTVDYASNPAGSVEVPVVSITMRGEEITQSIFKHVVYSQLHPATIKVIKDEATGTKDYIDAINAINLEADKHDNDEAAAEQAFNLLLAGTEHYISTESYVVTRQATVSRNFVVGDLFSADGKIISTNTLASYIGSALPFNAPLPFIMPQFNLAVGADILQLVYGWRKRPTEYDITSNGNAQIIESWQSARWTNLLYTLA